MIPVLSELLLLSYGDQNQMVEVGGWGGGLCGGVCVWGQELVVEEQFLGHEITKQVNLCLS